MALTQSRPITELGAGPQPVSLPGSVAANVRCFKGGIAVRNAAGFLQPATTATGLRTAGMFEQDVDNRGGVDGAKKTSVSQGVKRVDNSTGPDRITIADVGNQCFLVDDHTVARTDGGGTRSPGGLIVDVDADGVSFDCSLLGRKS